MSLPGSTARTVSSIYRNPPGHLDKCPGETRSRASGVMPLEAGLQRYVDDPHAEVRRLSVSIEHLLDVVLQRQAGRLVELVRQRSAELQVLAGLVRGHGILVGTGLVRREPTQRGRRRDLVVQVGAEGEPGNVVELGLDVWRIVGHLMPASAPSVSLSSMRGIVMLRPAPQ